MVTSSIANIASKMADVYGYDDEDFEEPVVSGESSKFPSARPYPDRATSFAHKTKRKARNSTRLSLPPPATRKSPQTSPRDRVLSSTRHELRSLQNKLADLERQLGESVRENKLLKRLQVRQEKDLGKMQQQEGELPQILQRHNEEIRSMREQLRRSQGTNTELRRMVNSLSDKVSKEENEHKRMEKLIRKKGLKERELLTWQLQTANEKIAEQNKREKELERAMEVTSKAHSQEMKAALGKHRQSNREVDELQNSVRKLKWQLKEKEKEVQVMNIYSQRIQQTMPRQLPSSLVRPMCDDVLTQTTHTYPPKSTVSLSITTITSTTATQTLEDTTSAATKPVSEMSTIVDKYSASVSSPLRMSFERSPHSQSTVTYTITEATPTLTFASPITSETAPTVRTQATPSFTQTTPSAIPQPTQAAPHTGIQAPPTSTQTAPAGIQAPPTSTHAAPVSTSASIQTPPTSTFTVNSSSEPTRKPQITADRSDLLKTLFGSSSNTPAATSSSLSNQPAAEQRERRPSQSHSERSQSNTPGPDAEARKKELLNILFADTPAQQQQQQSTTSSSTASSSQSVSQRRSDTMKMRDSSASITSWSDKLQNLHEGKPAFATDQDPYGSQALGKKDSRTFLTDLQSRSNSGETQHKPRHGRRATQLNDIGTPQTVGERKNKEPVAGLKPTASDVIGGYRPSVGPVGGKPRRHSEAVRSTAADTDTANVFDFSRGTALLLQQGYHGQDSSSNGESQPHTRALNRLQQNGRSSASIGVLALDDDIEELVI